MNDNLRALSICSYILAAATAVVFCLPLLHFGIGVWLIGHTPPHAQDKAPLVMMGSIFIALAVTVILAGWIYSACLAYSGRCLAQRRHYIFCMVMAALNCCQLPLGTILGIFTIIELNKPEVKAQFSQLNG
jgi:hypothetical protein